jgi:prepilin-type N-terminal cleavage/methylation domain-containing protein
MISTRKNRRGFTLVEILVVVLIIVILMGLLFPAIQAARENARAVQCINNQQELGKAIAQYAMTKDRLPGVLSFASPTDPSSAPRNWVMTVLGDLGRMELWEYWQRSVLVGGQLCDPLTTPPNQPCIPVKVSQLICPSNVQINPVGGLSYPVNLGVYTSPGDFSGRLFRDRTSTPAEPDQTLTSLKSPNRTVMLSEILQTGLWTDMSINSLAFQWPSTPTKIKDFLSTPQLGSPHRGNFIMTFFDGHTEKIPQDTLSALDPDNQLIGTP